MTWVQLCTMERRPSLLMDGQQSSIIKATRSSTNLTTNHWQLTTDNRQTTTNNWQLTTYNRSRSGRDHLMGQRSHLTTRCWANISFIKQHFFELMALNVYVPTISSDIEKLRLLYQCPTTYLQKCNTGAICSVPPMVLLLWSFLYIVDV